MKICQNCNTEVDSTITFYPTIMIDGVKDIKASVAAKLLVCNPCLGKLQAPNFMVSFNPVHALRNWIYTKNKESFPYLISSKIYAYKSERRNGYWAYAIVTNGDYFDIAEPHVSGYVPEKITEKELAELARPIFNINKTREYPAGYLKSITAGNTYYDYTNMINLLEKYFNENC